ncbi:MAG: hypothetical protein QW403_01065 [Candidatus Aenigmatarchaeota archaeon]
MSKGISLMGVVLVALFTLIIAEFVILQTAIVDSSELIRAVREAAIAEDINSLEFLKRAEKHALNYSFYGSYYFLGKRGGYLNLQNLRSYGCVPYWQFYDEKNYPSFSDITNNLKEATQKIFYKYLDNFRSEEIFVPYYTINIKNMPSSESDTFPSYFDVEATANQNLKFESKYVKIEDKSGFSERVNSGFLSEYLNAKNFIESRNFKQIIIDAINELNLKSSCSLTKSEIPSDEEVFSDSNCNGKSSSEAKTLIESKIREKLSALGIGEAVIIAEITSSCSYSKTNSEYTKTCSFEFNAGYNALVKILSSSSYPLEDGVKKFEFKFRILVGTKTFPSLELINSCTENL